MSSKRRPGNDINRDNWDQDDEPEESGEFQKASEEEISKRTIKTAKRRIKTVDGDAGAKASVFSSFGGFGKDNGKSSALAFSFLSANSATNGDASKKENLENKQSSAIDGKSAKDEKSTVGLMDDKNQLAYYGKLKGLNQSITQWIQKKVEENPFCILTPIFDDYAKHLKIIQETQNTSTVNIETVTGTNVTSTNPNETKITDAAKTFTFASLAAPTSTTNLYKSVGQDASPKTLLGFGTQNPSESNKGSSVSLSTAAPTFSFGNLTSTATTSASTGFSFGGPGAKPFTFGNVAKPTDASKPSDTNENEENADEDHPPKYEFVPVVEKDNFYSKRCKIFVKGDKGYADRGVGMLYLKKVDGSEKIQLLVRADTSLGNILLNILLSDGMPTQRMGKNNVMIICLPTPDAQAPCSVLIRVKNEEEADNLLTEINKNKK